MEKRQRFSAEFKREALRLIETSGKPASVIVRALGVPRDRLYKWVDEVSKKSAAAFGRGEQPKASNDDVAALKCELDHLNEEDEILQKSGGVLRAGVVVKYAWMEGVSDHSVRVMRQALRMPRSGYYAWKTRKSSSRRLGNDQLIARTEVLHRENHEACGSERLWRALRQEGEYCGRHRARRLRCEQGIRSCLRLHYLRTEIPYQRVPTAPNRLGWPFASPDPDRIWVAHITFIPTRQGWVYLAAVSDLCNRHIVNWAMSDRADHALASDALAIAFGRRWSAKSAIHHRSKPPIHQQALSATTTRRWPNVQHEPKGRALRQRGPGELHCLDETRVDAPSVFSGSRFSANPDLPIHLRSSITANACVAGLAIYRRTALSVCAW